MQFYHTLFNKIQKHNINVKLYISISFYEIFIFTRKNNKQKFNIIMQSFL